MRHNIVKTVLPVSLLLVAIPMAGSAFAAKGPFILRASATYEDGSKRSFRHDVAGIRAANVDVVRRSRSSVTVGYPSARLRRREGVKRCALITYRLRLDPARRDPVERARELQPSAAEEGTWSRIAADNTDVGSGGEVVRGAWRYFDDIVDSSRLVERGAAVAELAGTRGGVAELTVDGRMVRGGSLCGGLDESYFTLGVNALAALRQFQ